MARLRPAPIHQADKEPDHGTSRCRHCRRFVADARGPAPGQRLGPDAARATAPGRTAARCRAEIEQGTAIIRGRVTAGDSGKPLRRARVTLTAPELLAEAGAETVALKLVVPKQ
jgi:hypothetical protein